MKADAEWSCGHWRDWSHISHIASTSDVQCIGQESTKSVRKSCSWAYIARLVSACPQVCMSDHAVHIRSSGAQHSSCAHQIMLTQCVGKSADYVILRVLHVFCAKQLYH